MNSSRLTQTAFLISATCIGAVLFGAVTPALGDEPALGLLVTEAEALQLPPYTSPATATATASPPIVRLVAPWQGAAEGATDEARWSALDSAVERLHDGGYRVVLAFGGAERIDPAADEATVGAASGSLAGWLDFLRRGVRRYAGRVSVFEIGDPIGEPPPDPRRFALTLKQSALAVRAEAAASGHEVRVAQAALQAGRLDYQRRLWERDVAAYVDILPLEFDVSTGVRDLTAQLQDLALVSLRHPPAPEIWVQIRGANGWDGPALTVAALAAGASSALFTRSPASAGADQASWLVGMQGVLAEGYGPSPPGRIRLLGVDGRSPAERVLGRFFRDSDFTSLVVYQAPRSNDPALDDDGPQLVIDASVVRNARIVDPLSGEVRRVPSTAAPGGDVGRAVRLTRGPAPRALSFQKQAVTPGFELPEEDLEIARSRGLTAEEIIARHQQVMREQEDRLERWMASGRIEFHFKLAQGGASVDIAIESNYFWERGGELEWEQTDYFVNGNQVKWKNIPELPLIQPEKVVTLPLDLTLDRSYAYRLTGEERVDGEATYVLEFQPGSAGSSLSLYRGRIWIDKQSFLLRKASLLQSGLDAPVLSNEEVDRFAEQTGPGGERFWMFSKIDGQQVWTAGGRNFVVRRELSFRDYEINPPQVEFDARQRKAYASRNQMLRDTSDGFRYLERQEDGTRVVKQEQDTSQLFLAGGAFKDNSRDNVVPLGGVNYFDYDFLDRKIQVNALFAGVVGFFTVSKPGLFGSRLDFTADAGFSAIKGEDKIFQGDDELVAERIEARNQRLALRLGVPAGQFLKFTFVGGLTVRQFFEEGEAAELIEAFNEDNDPQRLEFVLPEDHLQLSAAFEAEFNRRGYTVAASASRARRSDWEVWGLRDASTGDPGRLIGDDFVVDPASAEPARETFTRWGATAFKEWYLPKFQKLRGTVSYLDGSDLDRYSRYQFSFFGDDRLNGFSGSGVRFDRGWIGRLGYAFNLFEVIRLDAALEQARVEQEDVTTDERSFTGVGLSANFVAPWKTVINISYGYALSSDIPDLKGEQEFLVLILKLF